MAFVRQKEMYFLVVINTEDLLINVCFNLVPKICHFVKRAFLKNRTEILLKIFNFYWQNDQNFNYKYYN